MVIPFLVKQAATVATIKPVKNTYHFTLNTFNIKTSLETPIFVNKQYTLGILKSKGGKGLILTSVRRGNLEIVLIKFCGEGSEPP